MLYIVVTHLSERNLEILEKKELREILKFYKNIYIGSTLDINDKSLFSTWYEFLKDYSFEQVRNAIIKRSTQSTFPANILEIISNIEVPDYTIELIEPYTVIVSFEDEEYGNFPFRFFNSQEAKKNIEKFKECSYDKESIKMLHEEQQYHSQSTYNPNQYQQPKQNQQQDSFMNENPPFNIMEDDIQF